jgi:hypothetical protein
MLRCGMRALSEATSDALEVKDYYQAEQLSYLMSYLTDTLDATHDTLDDVDYELREREQKGSAGPTPPVLPH